LGETVRLAGLQRAYSLRGRGWGGLHSSRDQSGNAAAITLRGHLSGDLQPFRGSPFGIASLCAHLLCFVDRRRRMVISSANLRQGLREARMRSTHSGAAVVILAAAALPLFGCKAKEH